MDFTNRGLKVEDTGFGGSQARLKHVRSGLRLSIRSNQRLQLVSQLTNDGTNRNALLGCTDFSKEGVGNKNRGTLTFAYQNSQSLIFVDRIGVSRTHRKRWKIRGIFTIDDPSLHVLPTQDRQPCLQTT